MVVDYNFKEYLEIVDVYWCVVNYFSVGMLFLMYNLLLC